MRFPSCLRNVEASKQPNFFQKSHNRAKGAFTTGKATFGPIMELLKKSKFCMLNRCPQALFHFRSTTANIALYADDTKIWKEIHYSEDHFILQGDINKLNKWSEANKMKFYPSKCKPAKHSTHYTIYHIQYSIINLALYLLIMFNCRWT